MTSSPSPRSCTAARGRRSTELAPTRGSRGPRAECRMQLGAGGARQAVLRPAAAVLAEGPVVGRVPVARGDHEIQAPGVDELAQPRRDLVALRHGQHAAGREVVLDVAMTTALASRRATLGSVC